MSRTPFTRDKLIAEAAARFGIPPAQAAERLTLLEKDGMVRFGDDGTAVATGESNRYVRALVVNRMRRKTLK